VNGSHKKVPLRSEADYLRVIASLRKREKKLRAALREKDIRLKEINHRVKNNIQIISSLLRLQAGEARDAKISEILKTSQSRIRSISLIHEKLYQFRGPATVNLGDYVRDLAAQLFDLAAMNPAAVRLEVEAQDIRMEAKRAVSCGLIVNELVLNALKYAFPQGRKGTVRVEMERRSGARHRLVVSDDGIGLPPAVDPQRPERLGFQIVGDLVKELNGQMLIDRQAGTRFEITF
jgi:two-component sensor histidine kinase